MENKVTNKQISFLKSVLLSQLLLEANEELIVTTEYKQDLKQQINRVNRILEPIVKKEFNRIYDTDPETTTNILNKIESLIMKLKTYQIDELVMIESVIDKYENNKEWFLKHAESEFLRID